MLSFLACDTYPGLSLVFEKYNFSFLPGSGAYTYDKENSKKGSEGFVVFKRRDDYWAKDHARNVGQNNFYRQNKVSISVVPSRARESVF